MKLQGNCLSLFFIHFTKYQLLFQIVHFIVWLLVSRERLSATIQHETTSMAGEAVFAESATSVSLQSASTTNVGEMGALRIRDTGSSTLLGQGGHELNIV